MIIDRYLTREISSTFIAVCTVLVVVFLTYSLTRFLTEAASGFLVPAEVLKLTILKSVIALEVLMPIGLYFGMIIGFGHLHTNSEITAMRVCGVTKRRVYQPILVFTILLTTLVGLTSTVLRPWAYTEMFTLEAKAEASSEIERIRAGQFYLHDADNRVVFVDSIANKDDLLKDIFIRTRKGDDIEVITSATGQIETYTTAERHKLMLSNAHIYKKVEDGPDFSGEFGKFTISIRAGVPEDIGYRTKSKSTLELSRSELPEDAAEFQWRLSTPLSTLLLALLAMRLSHGGPREGRFTRIPLALGVYAVYFNLLGIGRNWVEQNTYPYIWWAPLLLLIILIGWSIPWRGLRRQWA